MERAGRGTPLRLMLVRLFRLRGRAEELAPRMEDGFFLVPRLSTHEDSEA
jgi:hypothetical protein